MNFPNYEAIEAISGINIESQALQQQAINFFATPESQLGENQLADRPQQAQLIKTLAEKLKMNAEKVLESLK